MIAEHEFLGLMMDATDNDDAVVSEEGLIGDVETYIDSGSFALNALISGTIYGGYPGNRVSALAGAEGTGKTFAIISAIASYLEANPTGYVLFFETEGAVSKAQLVSHGVDPARVGYMPVNVVQDFQTQVMKVLDKYKSIPKAERMPMMIILDSLGMMTTRKEAGDTLSGSDKKDMTRPGAVRSVFRTITLPACQLNVPILMTNHTYQVVGSYVPMKEMAGGGGLKYAASTIIYLSKSKDRDSQKDVVGVYVTAKLAKGRFTREDKKIKTKISFESGMNRYEGLLPIAHKYDLVTKKGNKWVFPGCKPAFESAVSKNPTKYYTDELLGKIDEACRKEFLFGCAVDEGESLPDEEQEE